MSDITIGNLVVQMSANVARLSSDMAQAKGVVTHATDEISKAAESAMHALEAIGVGLSIHAFAELIRGSMEVAEHLLSLHKATGIAVEGLAGLSLLAKQNGTDIDSLAKAIEKLSVNMGKAPEDFVALGVSAKDPMEAFKQLADIFNLIPDIQTRNAVAMKALGKTWADIAMVMSQGSEEIGKTVDKGIALSHMTTNLAEQSQAFNDKWVELVGTGGFLNQVTAALLPVLNSLADDLLAVKESTGGSSTAFQTMGEMVGSGVAITKEAVIWLYNHKTAVEAVAGAYASWKIAAWLGPLVTEMAKSTVATYEKVVADMAAKAATVALAEANVAATAASVALTTARVAELRAAVLANEGAVALAITTNGLIPAEARLTAATLAHAEAVAGLAVVQREASVTAAATSGAISMLGGPLGVLITLLGIAATAWAVFGQKSGSAFDSANDAIARGMTIVKQFQKEAQFGVGQTGDLEAALDAVNKKIELLSQSHSPGAAKLLEDARAQADQLQSALYKTTTAQTGLTDEQKKAAAAAAEFLKTNDATKEGYAALANRINQYNAELTQQANQDTKVTEGEKLAIAAKLLYGAAITKNTQAAIDWMLAKEKSNKLMQDEQKMDAAAEKRYADALDAQEKTTQSVVEATAKMREHNAEMGKTSDELVAIRQATLDAAIATDQRALSILTENNIESEATRALQAHIAALQDQKLAMAETADAQKMLELQNQQVSLWKTIDSTAQQTFVSIFESGKSAFDRLRDTLKNGLYALLYEMTVKRWIISAVVGSAGTAVATSAFGSAAVASATGGLTGSAAFAAFASLPSVGTALSNLGTILPTFSTLMSQGASVMQAASAAFAGTAASFMAVAPYVAIGALVLNKLIGSGGGPKVEGFAASGTYTKPRSGEIDSGAQELLTAVGTQYQNLAAALGALPGIFAGQVNIARDPAGTANTQLQLAASVNGQPVYDRVAAGGGWSTGYENVGRSDAELQAAIDQASREAVLAALKATKFDSATQAFINAIEPTVEGFQKLSDYQAAFVSRKDLIASLSTESDKLTAAQTALADAGLPNTVAGFKAMAAGLDITTQAGQDTLAKMLLLKGALDLVTTAAEATARANQAWQDKIDVLTGTQTQIQVDRANALIGVSDATTTSLINQYYAQLDLNAATQKATADYDKLVSTYGLSIESLRAKLLDAFTNSPDIQTAGEAFATSMLDGINNAMAGNLAQQVATLMFDNIVDPIIKSLMAGKTLTEALTSADFDNAATLIGQATSAWTTLMGSPEWKDFLATIGRGVAGPTYTYAYRPPTTTSFGSSFTGTSSTSTGPTPVETERAGLQDQLNRLTKTSAELLLLQRDALAESNRALWDEVQLAQKVYDAKEVLKVAYQNELTAIESTIDRLKAFATGIRDFKNGLKVGDLSPLTPEDKYREAWTQYNQAFMDARSSDPTIAANAQGKLQDAATTFLTASRVVNASNAQYTKDFNKVVAGMTSTETWATQQVSFEQQSLDQLKLTVGKLINIDTGVKTVAGALAGLASAIALQAGKTPQPGAIGYNYTSPAGAKYTAANDSWTGTVGGSMTTAEIRSAVQTAVGDGATPRDFYDALKRVGISLASFDTIMEFKEGSSEAWARGNNLPVFAAGTNYLPGDMPIFAHEGERIVPQADNRELMARLRSPDTSNVVLIAEIKALRAEVAALRADQDQQTGAIIQTTYDANARAADKVAAGSMAAAKASAWAKKSVPVMK